MLKTYGTLKLITSRKEWAVEAKPHVMIRLKNLFPRVNTASFGVIYLRITPEICRDLEWFMTRFPLEADAEARATIESNSRSHRQTLDSLERILQPGYIPQVYPLSKPLRDYQARAVDIYLESGSLLLADQVGLGKSPTAIGSFTDRRTLPALVVCQTHLTRQWDAFVAEFLPMATTHVIKGTQVYPLPDADVYITTYHRLAGWAEHFKQANFLKSIVFDEVQELRRDESAKYKAARAIRATCDFGIGLSATPIYNYGGEIFNVLEMIAPGRVGSRDEFLREWCTSHGNGKHLLTDPDAFGEYLRDELIMLRRTRADVGLELPPIDQIVQTIEHSEDALDQIDDVATELAHRILKGSFVESGQAAREFDNKLRQATGISKAPFVAEFVRMLVEDDQKVLLFGWHREVYEVWQEKLRDLGVVMYTGSESPQQKERSKLEFIHGHGNVLIMSLRSGSGLNELQLACNTAVFGELDWSPGVHEQCIGRLNRDGLSGNVTAFYLVSEGGSDPIVASVLQLKKAQAHDLLDGAETELAALQSDTDRVKKLARAYLEKKHARIDPL